MRQLRSGHHTFVIVTLAIVLAACSPAEPRAADGTPSSSVEVAATPAMTLPSPTTAVTTTSDMPVTTLGGAGSIAVPAGDAPTIDGVLGPTEWEAAALVRMSDGAAIRLMYHDATLFLAVAGGEIGSVNVLLASENEVRILHSSAALGSALYETDAGQWVLVHGFSWCCRSRDDDDARLDLLGEEGWQANIGFTGEPGTVEFQIALPWQGVSLAVSSIRDQDDMGFWPADLAEEARLQLVGVPPEVRTYDLELWPVIAPDGA